MNVFSASFFADKFFDKREVFLVVESVEALFEEPSVREEVSVGGVTFSPHVLYVSEIFV